jgi:DMSO/TMAO reductase YedYZ molybdopterin-dependent catalytic subunit
LTPVERFPVNSYLVADPEIDLDDWRLEVSGLAQRTGAYTLDDLRRLPKVTQNTQHLRIEGWDVIGRRAVLARQWRSVHGGTARVVELRVDVDRVVSRPGFPAATP